MPSMFLRETSTSTTLVPSMDLTMDQEISTTLVPSVDPTMDQEISTTLVPSMDLTMDQQISTILVPSMDLTMDQQISTILDQEMISEISMDPKTMPSILVDHKEISTHLAPREVTLEISTLPLEDLNRDQTTPSETAMDLKVTLITSVDLNKIIV